MMKRLLFFISALSVLLSCAERTPVINVVPYPNDVQFAQGQFNVKGASVSYVGAIDEASLNVIEAFAQKLSQISTIKSPLTESDELLEGFCFVYDGTVPEEAYTIEVAPKGVLVKASGLRGFNYAIQTLKQMLPVEIFGTRPAPRADWTLPCVTINDAPRFAYRGLHLDECRHFFGIDEVKRYLDIMEVHKLNKFHWHLTEDQGWRIEIKKYPRLTEVGSLRKGTCIKRDFSSSDGIPYGEGMWYTHDQIREVVAYAASKGIDVIPEIDLPGHMLAALAAYPELGCTGGPYEVWTRWGVSEDVLCAGNDRVYEFLKDVLTEVCELFPYEYIHIGGDECPKVRWEACPKCQAKIKALGLRDKDGHDAEHYLQSHVMSQMEKFLNGKGRKIIGWDEILEGEIAPNATIMSWRGEAGGIKATGLGHKAIMTPNTYFYLDYYQSLDVANEPFGIGGHLPVERCYSYEPYAESMTPEQCGLIWGVQANLWTEYIAEADHLYYMLLPRLAALSEVQWCRSDRKDWCRFQGAADHFCGIYDVMDYNYAKHIFQVRGNVVARPAEKCVVVKLEASGNTPIRYTLNGNTPDLFSRKYTGPLVITESCELKAAAMTDDLEPKVFSREFDFHKAVGKVVTCSREPHESYRSGAPGSLVDAVRGPNERKCDEWVAWYGKPVDIIVDMDRTEPYSSVSVGLLSKKSSYVFLPQNLAVAVSEDGENYSEVASADYGVEPEDAPDAITDLTLSFPETTARYMRLTVTPVETIPQWHYAPGRRTFVFIDEIIVK